MLNRCNNYKEIIKGLLDSFYIDQTFAIVLFLEKLDLLRETFYLLFLFNVYVININIVYLISMMRMKH